MSVHDEWEASLLEQAREGLGLSGEEKARHLARLESNLAGGIAAFVAGDPALETSALTKQATRAPALGSPAKAWLWKVHPLSLLSGGLMVGGLAGLFAAQELTRQSPLGPVSTPAPKVEGPHDVARVPPVASPMAEAVQLEALEEQESNVEIAMAPPKQSSAPAASDTPPEPTFYEELSYLRRAQAALRGGNPSLALGIMTALDEIQKVGALDVERRVTRALALCALSRPSEAKAVSAPIFEKQSQSVYAKRLQESCVGALTASPEENE